MKLTKTLIATGVVASSLFVGFIAGPKLGKFGSLTEKKVGPKTIKVPYTSVTSYLDYAKQGSEDEIINGKKFTFIYVWIPAVAPELGVRMLSPVDGLKIKKATMTKGYNENSSSKEYFDTYITLEKSNISSRAEISTDKIKRAEWTVLAKNDDSSEMPKQPSGSSYNSLLRIKSETGNPKKALTKGLYRVGFTTYKRGEVKGTFLAQIGAPVKLPGVIITRDINELKK